MTTQENRRKALGAALVLIAALALLSLVPGEVGATPRKADGEKCRVDQNCSGSFCVKTPTSNKFGVCCTQSGGTEETCDGVDDDCDGSVDEDIVASTDETCDLFDDDCDGAVDEDYASQPTDCGVGACAMTGETICEAGDEQDTCTPGVPTDETCNGIDDDCDGATDEEFDLGAACSVGLGACEAAGVLSCDGNGGVACSAAPGTPLEHDSTCNGIDDDCDGQVDEDAPMIDVTCDRVDDDCDGLADDEACCQCAPQFCDPPVCNPQGDALFLCTSGPAESGCSSDPGFWMGRPDCDSCCDVRTCAE